MRSWLLIGAVFEFAVASAAHSQVITEIPGQANSRNVDFSLHSGSWINDPGPLESGMVTREDGATDTLVGVGLVKMKGRTRNGSDMQPGADIEVQKSNPAVTVVVKF